MHDFTSTLTHLTWTSYVAFKHRKSSGTDCMMTISTAASQRAFPSEEDISKKETVV